MANKLSDSFRRKYELKNFDGGLNNKYDPRQIEDDQSPDLLNVVFDDYGSIETRKGSKPLNISYPVGSFSCDGLFTTRFEDGSTTMVAFFGSDMQILDSATFATHSSSLSFRTAGIQVDYAMYQNYMFIGWGGTPYKYNGVELTRHGVYSGSVGSAVTASNGTLTGTYYYRITNVNSGLVESNVSSYTTALTLASQSVSLTDIGLMATSYGISARKVYRTEAITSTTDPATADYFLLATISDNTTTYLVDNYSDSELGAAAPTDNGLPPNWKFVKAFQERLWCVSPDEPNLLYYSEVGEPYTFKTTNYIKVGYGDGEIITGLGVHSNAIMVYKEASVWLIYMQDNVPANWALVKTNTKYGCISNRSIVNFGDMQMFLGGNFDDISGFLSLKGTAVDPSTTDLKSTAIYGETKSETIEPDIFQINSSFANKTAGVLFKNKLWFATPYGGHTHNNYIFQYDFMRSGEVPYQTGSWVPFTGMYIECFTVYDNKLYGGSSDENGFVYELDVNNYYADKLDASTENAIDSYFWGKEIEGASGEEDIQKDYRYINLVVENVGDWDMNIKWILDSDSTTGTSEALNLDPGGTGSLWDIAVLGTDVWAGDNSRKNSRISFGISNAKVIQIGFDNQNTKDQYFKVIKGNIYYNTKGLR